MYFYCLNIEKSEDRSKKKSEDKKRKRRAKIREENEEKSKDKSKEKSEDKSKDKSEEKSKDENQREAIFQFLSSFPAISIPTMELTNQVEKKKVRFHMKIDIFLLKEVLDSNPYANHNIWKDLAAMMAAEFQQPFNARNLRERVEYLLKVFTSKERSLIRKSGNEEQYCSRDLLLEDVKTLRNDFKTMQSNRLRKDETNEAKRLRDEAAHAQDSSGADVHESSSIWETQPDTQVLCDLPKKINNKRTVSKKKKEDIREEEAYQMMKFAANRLTDKDEAGIFGEMMAIKIRKLSPRNRAIAQNHIHNYLFQIEMQEMDKPPDFSHLPANGTAIPPPPRPPKVAQAPTNITTTSRGSWNSDDDNASGASNTSISLFDAANQLNENVDFPMNNFFSFNK
ncbi:hypothetical protein GE061_000078 [Apolygus lucorum]|uniref:BESS domain-containing protein n=1 Tax=Apolygus lucorum TaxID=248454 RepID=A0A8S9Y7D4_APOLU|nr:hypothetical protein GE061_000078 [Apolygus lucorum]